jgi:hypothetical protein
MRSSTGLFGRRVWSAALLVALAASGCDRVGKSGADEAGEPAVSSATIDFVPFEEKNGKEEYNASGVVALEDSRLLFCDNNSGDALFEIALDADGRKKGPVTRRPIEGLAPDAVDDFEDMALVAANGRRYVVVTSSMHVKKAKKDEIKVAPSGLVRVAIEPDGRLRGETMAGFREWLVGAYPQLAAAASAEPDDGGLNIEGLAWDAANSTLLFGVRTPAPGGRPLVLPVRVKDAAGPWSTSALEALPAVALAIDSAEGPVGIRGLTYEPVRDGFLVLVGNATSDSEAPFAVYSWDGKPEGVAKRVDASFAKKTKPEGLARATVGGKPATVVVDDGGGFRVLWDDLYPLS